MPAATPTLETVITAVKTAIDAVNFATGTVLDSDLKFENELEGIEDYKIGTTGAIDLWIVTSDAPDDLEGEASGETYTVYPIICKYWNVRVGDANWEKTARTLVETVRDALSKAAAVFRIGGQVPIATPETASVSSEGFEFVEDQLVYKAMIRLSVEARRFG